MHCSTRPSVPAELVARALDRAQLWSAAELGLWDLLDLRRAIAAVTLRNKNFAAITLGKNIYFGPAYHVDADWLEFGQNSQYALLAHETVHVVQFEQSGSFLTFAVTYLWQAASRGYHGALQEVEAYAMTFAVGKMIDRHGEGVIQRIGAGASPAELAADLRRWYSFALSK